MDKSFEKVNPEFVRMLENDVNLAMVFEYMESVILESKKKAKGLYHNGNYYVPAILYRFTKALPFYSKYDIEKHLKKLVELGFVIQEQFYKQPSHQQKTIGYRINGDLVRWEKQFIPLKKLSDKTLNEEKGKEIKDLVNSFMFKIRSVYRK